MEPELFEQVDPCARGRAHGELWREQIKELTSLRMELILERSAFVTESQVLTAAAAHLPVLERLDVELHQELLGIAQGADLSAGHLVVLNHYTDLRDVPPELFAFPSNTPTDGDPGGCTAIYLNGIQGPVLAQTWDMHATAEPFVRMLRIKPKGSEEESLCFTLTGCLGMAGLGHHGVGVTINNLSSTDGQVGMVWPALVRKLLRQSSADDAYGVLMNTPLSSGHHYMIADGRDFHGVETSGKIKLRTQRGPRAAHVHTNHCFDPLLRQHESVSKLSTSFARMNMATTLYAQQRPSTLDEVWALLGSHDGHPRSICAHQDEERGDPSASRTCGRLAMRLASGQVRVSRGCSKLGASLDLQLERYQAPPPLEPGDLGRVRTIEG